MSKKTLFKRVALGLIAAMGMGFLTVPNANAVRITASLALSSATASTSVNDTATVTLTLRQTANQNVDSLTVRVSCDAPTGTTCPELQGYQDELADTAGVQVQAARVGVWVNPLSVNWTETQSSTTSTMRSVISAKAVGFSAAGTYTYQIYLTGNGGLADVVSGTLTTWTVTVTAPSTNATGGSALVYISADTFTASANRARYTEYGSATDSAIIAARGSALEPSPVGFAHLVLRNSAGETRVAVGSGFNPIQDSVTVTVGGPGLIRSTATGAPSKSATMSVSNGRAGNSSSTYATETLTIFNDGTAGTMTLTFSKGSTTLATKTVTFFGDPASVVATLNDTVTALGVGTVTLSGQLKDSGGNILTAGTMYVFSSDTKIAGAVPTTAVFGQTGHRCTNFTGTGSSTRISCSVTLRDTGTVTLTLGDSWTVANSSFTSTAVEMTITGNTVASATVAFDKTTYAPGERAVITITTKDLAGRLHASGATGALARNPISNYTLTGSTTLPYRGTAITDNTYSSTLTRYEDSGVETRVVTMPSFGADITYTISVPNHPATGGGYTDVTATAKVVDPNATAIATAQAAADAATDAALEAIDAANAATDAANLAAEAADAATVAAEEARDAADAATAAVEALATEVATLMAALKAQITTLARTVAKIAKKVNA